jgi:E2F/DP family winged-helix DNA-binding domain
VPKVLDTIFQARGINEQLQINCLYSLLNFQTVSLEWAGKVLLCGEDEDNGKQLRNKVRRIYDVANVLSALGLVCKITPKDSLRRRLYYGYCGPAIDNLHSGEKGLIFASWNDV